MSVTESGVGTIVIDHARLAELAAGILESGHNLRFSAPGSSMAPFIRPGDLIEVHPCFQPGPRPMDILLYQRPGGRVAAHRLVRRVQAASGSRLVMRGDVPPRQDETIEASQVLGRVTACEHNGRRWQLDSPWLRGLGRLWVLTLPVSYYTYRLLAACRAFLRRGLGTFFH
jgi:hypothetical protein